MTTSADHIRRWRERILHWARGRRNLFFLDSCGESDAGGLGRYELVVGQGARRLVAVPAQGALDWSALRAVADCGQWLFFALSYDLNRHQVPGLHPQRDALGWPLACLMVPERVVTLSRRGEVEFHGHWTAAERHSLRRGPQGAPRSLAAAPAIRWSAMADSLSAAEYRQRVADIQQQIAAGTFYEINLCLETVLQGLHIRQPFDVFRELVRLSPTPMASYVQVGSHHLMAASPERFLQRTGDQLYSQPIKGTAARHGDPARDDASRSALAVSVKERAEHLMIVDLMRNDLGRLCDSGTIAVPELFAIYGYRQVFQMISTIAGRCRSGVDFAEVMGATFPMGSMTGAPKISAMRHIARLEPASRGWYSGTVGYLKPDGDFDCNVVIRALLYDAAQHRGKFSVGSAITQDADAEAEYQECALKARAIRELLARFGAQSGRAVAC